MEGVSFSKLKIPVHKIDKGQDIVQAFKELQSLPEFHMYPFGNRNFVIRYVIYCYDPKSPLIDLYVDLKRRKESAAEYAGFERNKKTGKFPDEVNAIMALENTAVNDMIFCYLKLINNRVWTQIVTNEQLFDEYSRLLMAPVGNASDDKKLLEAANVKAKLREECKLISTDLDKLYKDLFGDNDDLKDNVMAKPIRPETV